MTTTPQRNPVSYKSMREYMMILEERGLLKRITAEVDLDYEVGAISYRDLVRTGPGLLFENIKDNPDKQLTTNIMYSLDQLSIAFNGPRDWVKLHDIVKEGMADRLPCVTVDDGPVKEVKVFGEDVDLGEIPTPLWHELDGGTLHRHHCGRYHGRPEDRRAQHGAVPLHDHRPQPHHREDPGRLQGGRGPAEGLLLRRRRRPQRRGPRPRERG